MITRSIACAVAASGLTAALLGAQAQAQTDSMAPAAPPAASAPAAPSAPTDVLANGTMAPDFTVQDRNGKPVKLSSYLGKTVVLDFWATWCGPCQMSLPHTNAVAEKYMKQNVVFLAINVSDTKSAFRAWLPEHAQFQSLKFLIDPAARGQDVGTAKYGVPGIPTQFVISPSGVIVASFVGVDPSDMGERDLQKAIQAAKAS